MVSTLPLSLSGAKWPISKKSKEIMTIALIYSKNKKLNINIGHLNLIVLSILYIVDNLSWTYFALPRIIVTLCARQCLIFFVHLRSFLNNYILPFWSISESNRIFRSFCIPYNYLGMQIRWFIISFILTLPFLSYMPSTLYYALLV